MKDYVDFVVECIKSLKNKPSDTVIEFTCPLCGGTAKCVKSSYNGHCRGECDCGISFVE